MDRETNARACGRHCLRGQQQWKEPTTEFSARHSRQIVDLMNRYGYDVMTLGNHELDYIDDLTRKARSGAHSLFWQQRNSAFAGLFPSTCRWKVPAGVRPLGCGCGSG